jgi:hypothetical protein
VIVLLLGACQKKEKKAGEKTGSGATQDQVAKPASDELRAMLAMVPVASEGVVGLDVSQLRASELYKAYQKDIESAVGGELGAIRSMCGFDPVQKITKVVAGGAGNRRRGDATAIIKGLGKAETLDCLTKAAASPPKGVVITVDGDYAMVERTPSADDKDAGATKPIVPPAGGPDGGAGAAAQVMPDVPKESLSLQFLDDSTVVIARRSGAGVDKAKMAEVIKLDSASSVTGSKGFMEMIDGIDTDAPVWFVINGKTPGAQKLGGGFLKFDAAFGQVYVASGLDIDVTLRLDSPASATRMADVIKRQVDSMRRSILKDALGEVKVEAIDRDMHLRVTESKEQLQKLVEEVGDLLAAFLGG